MASDFDWFGNKDRDAIVLGYQPPTAVYRSNDGNVIVRQKADETEEYDPQIFLTPQGALAVAWRLIEEAHLEGLPEPSVSLMVESPHWSPPVRHQEVPTGVPAGSEPEAGPLLKVMEAAE